ncbi:hypothetical protein L218DRAFT_799934, partial [Marasmius fiardii PR-910]
IQSFEQWHVPAILTSLPILLEFAPFFFAGFLELLWATHHVPFAIALSIVGLAVLFYSVTAILPGVSMIQQTFQFSLSYIQCPKHLLEPPILDLLPPIYFVCPYKSPQSWL